MLLEGLSDTNTIKQARTVPKCVGKFLLAWNGTFDRVKILLLYVCTTLTLGSDLLRRLYHLDSDAFKAHHLVTLNSEVVLISLLGDR